MHSHQQEGYDVSVLFNLLWLSSFFTIAYADRTTNAIAPSLSPDDTDTKLQWIFTLLALVISLVAYYRYRRYILYSQTKSTESELKTARAVQSIEEENKNSGEETTKKTVEFIQTTIGANISLATWEKLLPESQMKTLGIAIQAALQQHPKPDDFLLIEQKLNYIQKTKSLLSIDDKEGKERYNAMEEQLFQGGKLPDADFLALLSKMDLFDSGKLKKYQAGVNLRYDDSQLDESTHESRSRHRSMYSPKFFPREISNQLDSKDPSVAPVNKNNPLVRGKRIIYEEGTFDREEQQLDFPKFFQPDIPFFVESRFVRRDMLLSQIESTFLSNQSAVQKQRAIAALTACHGLGGVGKTQLALYYYHKSEKPYSFRCWFSAERLEMGYREFCEKFQLKVDEKTSFKEISGKVKQWLEENPGWVLVYDNVTDCDSIAPHLPTTGGDILVTSRQTREWDQIGGREVPVDVVSEEEAIELVKRAISSNGEPILLEEQDEVNLKKLVSELGYLPLALAQVAAYIKSCPGMTITSYFDKYMKTPDFYLHKALNPRTYPTSVAKTWLITMEEIERRLPAALPIFKACAYLASDVIPRSLLLELILEFNAVEEKEKKNEEADITNNQLLDEILICLSGFSMIGQNKKTSLGYVNVHHLVQEVIRLTDKEVLATEKILEERLRPLASAVLSIYQREKPHSPIRYKLIPHVVKVISYYEKQNISSNHLKFIFSKHDKENLLELYFLLGKMYNALFEFKLAGDNFKKADQIAGEIVKSMSGEDAINRAHRKDILKLHSEILFIFGQIPFHSRNRHSDYIEILEKSLDKRAQFLAAENKKLEEDSVWFDIKRHIGCVYINTDLGKAEDYFRRLLEEIENDKDKTEDHKIIYAQVCLSRGHIMYKNNDFDHAHQWLEKSIFLLEALLQKEIYSVYWARTLFARNHTHLLNPKKDFKKAKNAIQDNIDSLKKIKEKPLHLESQQAEAYLDMAKICIDEPVQHEEEITICFGYLKHILDFIPKLHNLEYSSKMKADAEALQEQYQKKYTHLNTGPVGQSASGTSSASCF